MPSITQKETSGRRKWEKTLGSRQAAAMVTTKLIPNAVAVLIAVQSIVLRYRLFMGVTRSRPLSKSLSPPLTHSEHHYQPQIWG